MAVGVTNLKHQLGLLGRMAWARHLAQAFATRFTGLRKRSLVEEPTSPAFDETFRLLALELKSGSAERVLKTILIMGAYPGDGRTLTVASLGIALAQLGCHVVVVESDARQKDLSEILGASFPDSLPVDQFGPVQTTIKGLEILPRAIASVGLQGADSLEKLVGSLSKEADFVIFDSPPCLSHSAGFLLASLVDGVVFVVKRRPQDIDAQRTIQSRLARLGAHVFGVIYNDGR